jgi:hypothetical protein
MDESLIFLLFHFPLAVLSMLLILGFVSCLYLACFFWFWLSCQAAIRDAQQHPVPKESTSNLIPFERGLKLRIEKTQRAM